MIWKEVKNENLLGPTWYNCSYSERIPISHGDGIGIYVTLRFSIFPRQGKDYHSEIYPYQLLIGGNRIYLKTIEEGKEICEQVLRDYKKRIRSWK